MEEYNVLCICATVFAIAFLVCVMKVILLAMSNKYNKTLILDERSKKDSWEKLYFDRGNEEDYKNRMEEIEDLKKQIREQKRSEEMLKKDIEIEKLKWQIGLLEGMIKKEKS